MNINELSLEIGRIEALILAELNGLLKRVQCSSLELQVSSVSHSDFNNLHAEVVITDVKLLLTVPSAGRAQ